jgi:hypothetical protein
MLTLKGYMKKEESKRFEENAKAGKIGKLNIHSVLRQDDVSFLCPHCNKIVTLKIDINERSSAVYFTPCVS